MNKIKQWCDAIRQEDGRKLSSGSLRTLKMIEDEFARMQANKISSKPMLADSSRKDDALNDLGNTLYEMGNEEPQW